MQMDVLSQSGREYTKDGSQDSEACVLLPPVVSMAICGFFSSSVCMLIIFRASKDAYKQLV